MNLFGAIGNIVGGAEHFIGNLFHGPAQPQQNYRPINLGPGSANLQGGGAQQVQRPQAPQFQIPHLNLNTMQVHQLPVSQLQFKSPNQTTSAINAATGFGRKVPTNNLGKQATLPQYASEVTRAVLTPLSGPTGGGLQAPPKNLKNSTPQQRAQFAKSTINAIASTQGDGLSNEASKEAMSLARAAKLSSKFSDFIKEAANIEKQGGGAFKSVAQAQNFFLHHNPAGTLDIGGKPLLSQPYTQEQLNNAARIRMKQATAKSLTKEANTPPTTLQRIAKTLKIDNQRGSVAPELLGRKSKPELPNERVGDQPKVTQPEISVNAKPGFLENYFKRPLQYLQKSQNPNAQQIAQMTKNALNYGENKGAPAVTKLEDAIKGLKPNEYEQAFLASEGKAKATSPGMKNFVATWNSVRQDIAKEAQGKKLTITDPTTGAKFEWQPRGNFAPHYSAHPGSSLPQDSGLNISSRKYGNLEFTRQGGSDYIKDPRVMIDYAKRAYQRLGYAGEYGPNNENLQTAIHHLESTGGHNESAVAQNMVSQLLHPQGGGDNALLRGVRSAEMIAKLPLVAMHHAPQIGDTAAQQGTINTIKSIPAAVKAFAKKEASPVARNASLDVHELPTSYDLNGQGKPTIGGKVLDKVYQFPRTLGALRTLNAEASARRGAQAAASVGRSVNARALENAGINPADVKNGKLTPDQLNQYIRENLKNASLTFGKGETPVGVQGGVGRTATQLKHFAYNRLVRTWPRVLSEAKHGNPGPLLKTLAFGTAIGTGEQVAQNAIENHPAPTLPSLVEQGALKGLSPGIGVTDAISSAINPKYTASNALGLLGGPAASDAVNLYNTANSYAQGKDRAYQTRNAISSSGPIGATAANYAFPTKSQQGNRPSDILTSGKPSLGRLVTQTNQQSTQATNNALANQVANAKTPSQRVAAEKALQSQISALTKQSAKNPGVQNQINQLRTQKALLSGGQTAVNKMNDTQARASLNQNGGNLQISGNKIYYRNASGSISTVDTGKLTKAKANSTSKTVFQLFQNQQLSQKDMLSVLGKIGVTPQQAEINYARGLGTEDKGAYVMDKLGAGSTAYGLAKAGILTTSVANNLYEGGSIDQKTYAKLYAAASQISKDLKAARTAGGYSSGGAKKLPKPPSISLTKMKAPIKIKAAPAPKPKYTIKSKLPSAASNSRKVTLTA